MKTSAVIVAGGRGRRMGAGINKVFLKLSGKEIISHTIRAFEDCDMIDEIVVVTGEEDRERMLNILLRDKIKKWRIITEGGAERQDSVYNGLMKVSGDIAVIHDGARCLITPEQIKTVICDASDHGAAALGVKVKDTLKSVDDNGNITGTIDREKTVLIQTPQVFRTEEIKTLHELAVRDNINVTDDCSLFEAYGKTVYVTEGSYDNIKLTTPEDIAVGERIIERRGVK